MDENIYFGKEWDKVREAINVEMLRRGTYSWFDPLSTPRVGEDQRPALTIPYESDCVMEVDDDTYTINDPSEGSIERTRNITHPEHGSNPSGDKTEASSAQKLDAAELRNFIVGLTKIQDINLFYGRDEIWGTAFRDPTGIMKVLTDAQNSKRNEYLHESDMPSTIVDPNGGLMQAAEDGYNIEHVEVTYPMENGLYVMPSGESDGEELDQFNGLGPNHFYDDYGAPEGVGDYHPLNPHVSPEVERIRYNEGELRNRNVGEFYGNRASASYGTNPRNPESGESYSSIPVMGGVIGACNVACTGLCSITCDSSCSESCSTTCFGRCGEACTSSCGNLCTGCSSNCYQACTTRCESVSGYACLTSGAKAVHISTMGGSEGEYASNVLSAEFHTCQSCSYTCQFYANKRTDCWDAACMGYCFTTCSDSCSTSCFGGCIDNPSENDGDYKTGIGRGCSSGCTINCIGACSGVCEGYCVKACFHGCMVSCNDNCTWKCESHCGSACADNCTANCEGSSYSPTDCQSCGAGCTSSCQHDCNSNCMGEGCMSSCGADGTTSCTANCRMNCTATSCTAKCSDHCSSACTTCVNTCGIQCGPCSSMCTTGCEAACNITCVSDCQHSCDLNCTTSCSDSCGGCSGLCYSCVGKCVGVCAYKCTQTCSNCTNKCSWWCDSSCGRGCTAMCDDRCISSCSGSCSTKLDSDTMNTSGPDYPPTAEGYQYPDPANRFEEQDSFRVIRNEIEGPDYNPPDPNAITVIIDSDERVYIKNLGDDKEYFLFQTSLTGGVFNIDSETGALSINPGMADSIIDGMLPNDDGNMGVFVFVIPHKYTDGIVLSDILFDLVFGFTKNDPMYDENGHIVIIIESRQY